MASLTFAQQRKSLLSSQARIQVPWVKVTIGTYTFGIFTKEGRQKNSQNMYQSFKIQYPNFIESLQVEKINGQVNQYTLSIKYPVTATGDPNFFEKVFSSVSKTRKIVFSYGDAAQPSYIYKKEEAIITKVTQTFNFGNGGTSGSVIGYTINAVSGAALGSAGNYSFMGKHAKPSDEIKKIFRNSNYGLQNLFTGMPLDKLDYFIAGGDKEVELSAKLNISALDYINYLVGCMIPAGASTAQTSKDIYILTIHDDTTLDRAYADRIVIDNQEVTGPYFKVTKISYNKKQADAYELDIGYNTSTLITDFQISQKENYSLFYDYENLLHPESYQKKLNDNGEYEDIYAPTVSSKNNEFKTRPEDITWWTKITKYPISASVTVQGLLRPAQLMTYLRLNIIFPGGHKHISSGLYLITKQTDVLNAQGYRTTLGLTKISGDEEGPEVLENAYQNLNY